MPACRASTSTSSSWVNGRATTTTTLQFYVAGSSERQALTSVREARGDSGAPSVTVQVWPAPLPAAQSLMQVQEHGVATCVSAGC